MTDTLWRNVDDILENSFRQSIVFTHIPSPNIAPLKLWQNVLLSAHKIGVRHLAIDVAVDGLTIHGKSLHYALRPALDLGWTINPFIGDPQSYFAQYKSVNFQNYSFRETWEMIRKLDGFPSRAFIESLEEASAKNLAKLVATFDNTPLLIGCAECRPSVIKDDLIFGKSLGWHFSQLTGNIPFVVGQNATILNKPLGDKYLPLWQPLFKLGGSGGYLLSELGDDFKAFNKLYDASAGAALWLIEQPAS